MTATTSATTTTAATTAPNTTADAMLSPASVPRIAHGFRLQWEAAQDCHVLLYPEGMVKLNPSAGEILKRCDGSRDLATIVAELEAAFSTQGLEAEVRSFVEIALTQRWLTLAPGEGA